MKVVVDRYAWLPFSGLPSAVVATLKERLTIVPKKVGDYPDDGEDTGPIELWRQTDTHLGVPREFFLAHRKPHHEVVMATTLGGPWPSEITFKGQLRPEQERGLEAVRELTKDPWRTGGILNAKPGWGKTVCSLAVVAELKVPTLVLVHKEFLMDQWAERIREYMPDAKIGFVQQDVCDFQGKHIVLAMVHSLANRTYPAELFNYFGLLLADECFVGSTPVWTPQGSVPISSISVGSEVLCAAGSGQVRDTFSQLVERERLRLIRFEDQAELVCTDSHPFLTSEGWKRAEQIANSYVLTYAGCVDTMSRHGHSFDASLVSSLSKTSLGTSESQVLLSCVCEGVQSEEGPSSVVRVLWKDAGQANKIPVLFKTLCAELDQGSPRGIRNGTISSRQTVASREASHSPRSFGTHAQEESHARRARSAKGPAYYEGARTSSFTARGERSNLSVTSTSVERALGTVMGNGVGSEHGSSGPRLPARVQDRHCLPPRESCDRGGWSFSQQLPRSCDGQEEIGVPAGLGVVGVKVPEQADLDRLGIRSEGDSGRYRVFNIAVSNHPSYVVGSCKVLVHNCHRVSARTWSGVPSLFPAKWRFGVTATPRRKDGCEEVFFTQLGKIFFTSTEQRLGVKVKRVFSEFRLIKTDRFNPALAPRSLILKFLVRSRERNAIIAAQLVRAIEAGRKVLVLSEQLAHLDAIEGVFQKAWQAQYPETLPEIGWYVGGRSKSELQMDAKADLILATSQYAKEGLDIPDLDTLILASPLSDVEQAVGRIQRPFTGQTTRWDKGQRVSFTGKKEPIVVDIRDDAIPMFFRSGEARDVFYGTLS